MKLFSSRSVPYFGRDENHVPAQTILQGLLAGGSRGCVEQDVQYGKGECGLDEYETRGWIGWRHHMALSILALWFLTLQQVRFWEKNHAARRARERKSLRSKFTKQTL